MIFLNSKNKNIVLYIKMYNLNPKPFDLNKMKEHPTIVLIAKRRSGKSVCIRELIYHFNVKQGIKTGVVCSHSEDFDPFYSNFFPQSFIYYDCEHMLEKVIERQQKLKDENIKLEKAGKPRIDPNLLVVLDDVIDNNAFAKSQKFKDIIFNGRHYDITFIIAIQYAKSLPPDIRQNFDYVFLFNNDIPSEIKKIYEGYAGIFPSEKIFRSALQTFTRDYQILVIIMAENTQSELNNKCAIFKANINLSYNKFISKSINKYDKKHFNVKWKETKKGITFGANGKYINVHYE